MLRPSAVRVSTPIPEPDPPRLRAADRPPYVRLMEPGPDRVSSVIEGVLERFRRMVRSVGAKRGLVDADLDEVIQDVRIRLWQASKRGKPLEELGSSYLYQVATTAALEVLRRRRTHGADRSVDVHDRPDLPSTTWSPLDDAEGSELAAQIDAALQTIAIDRRVAVRMHLAGYDRDDISRALGWTDARTRNLLYRGLEDLRQRLTAMGIAPRRER